MSKIKGKIYTSGGGDCAHWLYPLGFERAKSYEEADVIAFSGGSDISPALYGERPGRHTGSYWNRDRVEVADFRQAVQDGKKCIGICRGLQLICALNGGRLIQHVSNHHGSHVMLGYDNVNPAGRKYKEHRVSGHDVRTDDLRSITVNSIHHQMIYPYDLPESDYRILAWSDRLLSTTYLGENDREITLPKDFVEIEACYFPKTHSMGWQYHPEMMNEIGSSKAALNYTQEMFLSFYTDQL
jgi:gamma-glutamyl-gamma-aminobutyrate hydrolase PuuD